MSTRQANQRRKRGVFLSQTGWQRLQAAERQSELQDNKGIAYTLETLSTTTGLSPNTLTKVRRQQAAVDRQTIEIYFNAFDIELRNEDLQSIDPFSATNASRDRMHWNLSNDSPYYIARPELEDLCYQSIWHEGALVHIRAPAQSGKTTLVKSTLARAAQNGAITHLLSLKLADSEVLQTLERFSRWFCAVLTQSLGLENRLSEFWDPLFGNSFNCTHYFEHYLLKECDGPVVIALDDIDILINQPAIAKDFFQMLRVWYEQANSDNLYSSDWKKLRFILVHSYAIPLSNNLVQLPANFGITIDLPDFTQDQVADLAKRYGLERSEALSSKLINFFNGKPSLTQLALYALNHRATSLDELVQTCHAPDSIFAEHLLQQLYCLQNHPALLDTYKQVLQTQYPVVIPFLTMLKLKSLGLVRIDQQKAAPACELYQRFFSEVLAVG
jgi:AraC-like DNA-binding protein